MGQTSRRRYDTQALIGRMHSDRRNSILLGLAGIGVFAFLVIFYFVRFGGDEVPKVPETAAALAPVKAPAPPPKPPEVKPTPPPEPPAPPPPATVVVQLVKPGPLWLADKLIGPKTKTHEATLAAGAYPLKTKLGKKVIQETLTLEAGKRYKVTLDAKKKRFVTTAEAATAETAGSPPK